MFANRFVKFWPRHVRLFTARPSSKPFPVLPQSSVPIPPVSSTAMEILEQHQKLVDKVVLVGGGPRAVERHTKKNKKILVRERIKNIIDPDEPFFELMTTCGMGLEYGDVPAAGMVLGVGKINGVHCIISANDNTVKGGTAYPISVTKMNQAQQLSQKLKIPTVAMVDSGGAFLPLQSEIFPDAKHGGRTFYMQAVLSSQGVPQIALVSGMCTAGAAYTPSMSDQVIMVDKIATIFLGGPPLVKAATGEIVSGEELGGAKLHCSTSGVADYFSMNEEESFNTVRDIVATLNIEEVPVKTEFDDPMLGAEYLDYISGQDRINKDECYSILATLTDGSRFLEFKREFGCHLITGFGYLHGNICGFVINCGAISAADAQKGSHFVQLCNGRSIPLIFLQNSSNSANSQCDAVTIKERAKFVQSQSTAGVPKITVNVGGLSADENFTMCGPSFGATFAWSWPGSKMAKNEPVVSDSEEKAEYAMPAQYWAGRATYDGILFPRDTRKTLAKCVHLCLLNFNKSSPNSDRLVLRM